MIVITPPHQHSRTDNSPLMFLAGSIEMDKAEPWQNRVIEQFADLEGTILNPRRDHWDAGLRQHPDEPEFRGQVEWELEGLEAADIIAMYLDPATKSPVSLLELGLFARSGKLLVCCPDGFWRQGNVAITCQKYGVPYFTEEMEWLAKIRKMVGTK
jgi:hypothetical protein